MGGCIAMTFAARHPDRLSGLVLADTFGPVPLTVGDRLWREALRLTIPPARPAGYERVERGMVWLQQRLSGAGVAGDYGRIEAIRDRGPRMATEEFAKVIRAIASFHRTRVDFGAIRVPTLLLYGEHETGVIRRQMHELAALIRDAHLFAVPHAGHVANLDNEAFVGGAIRGHLGLVWPDHAPRDDDPAVVAPGTDG